MFAVGSQGDCGTLETVKDLTGCPGVLCGVEDSVGVGGWYEIVE